MKILIVDDERAIRNSLREILSDEGYAADVAEDGARGLEMVQNGRYDIVFCDIKMPNMDGQEFLAKVTEGGFDCAVIMISGHADIKTAVECIRGGAFDFIEKPLDLNRILITVKNAGERNTLVKDVKTLKKKVYGGVRMVGESAPMQHIREMMDKVAATDARVLITGPNGSGKELVARGLHSGSQRADMPYVEVNCAAIPSELIESELFGHEKGAFTSAIKQHKGKFEQADGGTLFLDEVAELPISTQARLLRVLQTGEFMKVGSSKVQRTNVRVVAATNCDLHSAIAAGKFRKDLYYRLNTVPIVLPPLRERKEDIYKLFRNFAADFSNKYTMPSVRLTPDAIRILEEYRWPGNIRELKSVAERISILETERLIDGKTLSKYLLAELDTKLPAVQDNDPSGNSANFEFIFKMIGMLKSEIDELKKVVYGGQPAPVAGNQLIAAQPQMESELSEPEEVDIEEISTKEIESDKLSIKKKNLELIRKALEKYDGNRKLAAAELGISERTLYRKLKELEEDN